MVVWNGDINGPNRGLLAVIAEPTRPAPPMVETVITTKRDRQALRTLMADGQARTITQVAAALRWDVFKATTLVRKAYSRGWLKHVGKGWYRVGRTHTVNPLPFTSEERAS